MGLSEDQKRIVEIKALLHKEYSGNQYTDMRVDFFGEKERLFAELSMLESREQFRLSGNQHKIGIGSVCVGILAIIVSGIVSFWVPYYSRIQSEHDQVEAVYKNLVTNQDIFISNSNEARKLSTGNSISSLPELYLEEKISDETRKIIQNAFGLIQYRFFLYYLQQTDLLNEEIKQIRTDFIIKNPKTFIELVPTQKYLATMEYLTLDEKEKSDSKFDYQMDTGCLQYFFEQSFLYIVPDGRGASPECSYESLNRVFNFGYLESDTPLWLKPLLRDALDQRGNGLGSRIIKI
jgi:hypothetical protein